MTGLSENSFRVLFFVERNLHLPFLEPIHDYFQLHLPGFELAFASPEYSESNQGSVGRGLDVRTVERLSSKARYVRDIRTYEPDITVVADIGAAYILRDCGRIVNVGHGMISKGCFYTRQPIVKRENIADLICVPGEWHRDILAENVFSAIVPTGFIKADGLLGPKAFTRDRFCHDWEIPLDARILLFAPTYNEELSAIPFVQERVVELARAGTDGETHLVVKLHGMTDRRWIDLYAAAAEADPRVHVLPITYDLTRVMVAADLMISDVSSAFVEFMLLDRPIVLFDNPRKSEFQHFDPRDLEYQVRDACVAVSSWEELRDAVDRELQEPSRLSALRRQYADRMCLGRDGRSVERAALAIAGLPRMRHPVSFTVVIPWLGGEAEMVAKTSRTVRHDNPGIDLELVFVGRRPADASLVPDDRWVDCAYPTGRFLDQAVTEARYEHVAFWDPRLVTPVGWLRQLANYYCWEPKTGVVQAIGPGMEQRVLLEHMLPGGGRKSNADVAFIFHRFLQGGGMTVGGLDTACFLIRKDVYAASGGFPPDLGWEQAMERLGLAVRRSGLGLRRAVETYVYPLHNVMAGIDQRTKSGPVIGNEVLLKTASVPDVSIIIPVCGNMNLTRDCIRSILENTSNVSFEIIAVDNGSTDGTAEMLIDLEREGTLRRVANQANLGFAKACNQGAKAANGRYLVFLNNDTLVQGRWLDALRTCAARDERIGAVGAKLLFEDGLVQHAGVVFDHKHKPVHIYKFFHPQHPAVRKQREFQAVSAACMLVGRYVFERLGGFDEEYVNGYEDVDFCLRLRKAGHKVVYCPKSVVTHLESKTPGRFDAMNRNRELLMRRWGDVLVCDERDIYRRDGIEYELVEEHEHGHVCVMHDGNPNPYWHRAKKLAEQGAVDKAVAAYQEAYRFFAFDPRKYDVLEELAELSERSGMLDEAEHYWQGLVEAVG
ncbi:MAG: glycosyltransferase, partial [Desulfovibrionales bacterium]